MGFELLNRGESGIQQRDRNKWFEGGRPLPIPAKLEHRWAAREGTDYDVQLLFGGRGLVSRLE